MGDNEDQIPLTYPYEWSEESNISLDDFLKKYRPSMVQNDGAKPWIWVKGTKPSIHDDSLLAQTEAAILLKEVTEKVENIKNDASIPTRSNKKTGAKSKKELREQVQGEASDKLKEIAIRYKYTSGKWIIFAPKDKVDLIWTSLAKSLVSGPLAATSVDLGKVSTCPQDEIASAQHLICLYVPNVYDKDDVTTVMRVLLRDHGMNLAGVKSNLYTSIGIDSKHPSGIQSTTWKPTALLKDTEIKELRDAFFADLAAQKPIQPKPEEGASNDNKPASSKKKPQLKKKALQDDPFSDGDDADEDEDRRKQELQALKKGASEVKTKRSKESDDEEDQDERQRKKKKGGKK